MLAFNSPALAHTMRPGQFALARDATLRDPYLRRVLSLYQITDHRVAFTLPATDPLAHRARVGDELDLLAPLGHAIEFNVNTQHIVLIGADPHLAPLIAIAQDAITHGHAVVLVTHTTTAPYIFPAHLLAPEIEYRAEGNTFDPELIAWADAIVASGNNELYRTLANAIRDVRYRLEENFARVIATLPMPCGVGACGACAVDTIHGVRFACVDGLSFDLVEYENRRAR